MKKILLSFVLLFYICLLTYGQEHLYLVSGTPFYYKLHYPVVKPIIFSFEREKKSLDTLQVLSVKDSTYLGFLNVYQKYGLLVMYEESGHPNYQQTLTMVNLNKPTNLKVKSLNFGKHSSRMANLLISPEDSIYYGLHIGGVGYFAYDMNLNQSEISPESFNYVYIQGVQGTAINSTESLRLKKMEDESYYLSIRKYLDKKEILYSQQPPMSLRQDWGMYFYYYPVAINTDHILAINANASIPTKAHLGEEGFFIKNKLNNEWYYQKFKGGLSTLVGFNEWIAGNVKDYNRGYYLTDRQSNIIDYNFNRTSPGKEVRRSNFSTYQEQTQMKEESENFEERSAWFGNYYSGILFLFNVQTKTYIEWNTRQGDSEILLVEDNFVYYRVNDAIYQAAIINEKQLGKAQLLIQDIRVPDIHWAFISKDGNK